MTHHPSDDPPAGSSDGAARVDHTHLRGHRFPGGTRTIEHWENWLLTDCTGRGPMADDLVHPIALFHVPIQGSGTSIGELFELFGSTGAPGEVSLLGYDWEYPQSLRESVAYRVGGWIDEVEPGPRGTTVTFVIEMETPDGHLAARVANRWRFNDAEARASLHMARSRGSDLQPTDGIGSDATRGTEPGAVSPPEPLDVLVDGQRMKTMAALLRDPYPIHWDPAAVAAIGLGDRPINQGPLNLAYVANMLMAWAGDDSVRRLTVRFHDRVHAGDEVRASGSVDSTEQVTVAGDTIDQHHCTVRLDRGDEPILSGTAVVTAPQRS